MIAGFVRTNAKCDVCLLESLCHLFIGCQPCHISVNAFYYSDSQDLVVDIRLKDEITLQVALQALDS